MLTEIEARHERRASRATIYSTGHLSDDSGTGLGEACAPPKSEPPLGQRWSTLGERRAIGRTRLQGATGEASLLLTLWLPTALCQSGTVPGSEDERTETIRRAAEAIPRDWSKRGLEPVPEPVEIPLKHENAQAPEPASTSCVAELAAAWRDRHDYPPSASTVQAWEASCRGRSVRDNIAPEWQPVDLTKYRSSNPRPPIEPSNRVMDPELTLRPRTVLGPDRLPSATSLLGGVVASFVLLFFAFVFRKSS